MMDADAMEAIGGTVPPITFADIPAVLNRAQARAFLSAGLFRRIAETSQALALAFDHAVIGSPGAHESAWMLLGGVAGEFEPALAQAHAALNALECDGEA